MYELHFGLRHPPFRSTPDTKHYYPATPHERVLAQLLQALHDQEGIILLSAEPGLGKTLLCQIVLERLGTEVASAFLTNSHLPDRLSLLQAVLFELGLPHDGHTEQGARLVLTDYLLKNHTAGRPSLLIADEAQHLLPDLLEELRLLGNLEAGGAKALQVLLAAQPSIGNAIERPELAALRQRLAVRAQLEALSLEESADYLRHQIRLAGGRPDAVLAEEALELLARGSRGVPRCLNQAAHQAFRLAHEAGAALVDAEAALEALALLGLEAEEPISAADVAFPVGRPDSGPLLSLAESADEPHDACDPGDTDDYARIVQPKRPA